MLRRLLGVAAVAASVIALGVPRALAGDGPDPTYYLALGDSLAAGFQPDPAIGRDSGYVTDVYDSLSTEPRYGRMVLENLGCDGATTTTLASGGGCAYPGGVSQLAAAERFLRENPGRVKVITIDIGGNDINRCAAGGVIDQACALAAVGTIGTNLAGIVGRLDRAAPGVPIVGMTYYDPYLAAWLAGPAGQALAQQSVQLITVLNRRLTEVYESAGAEVADVGAAFDTTDLTTPATLPDGRTVPLAVFRICAWTWMCVPGGPDIHPNTAGYRVIADTFLDHLPG